MSYSETYERLIESRRKIKHVKERHLHHIIPKHAGGTNEKSNLVSLSVREHVIAHWLLWKIHKKPNDLRSMHMLGAKLSCEQRRIVGVWCHENKIGFHGATMEERKEWCRRGHESMIRDKIGIFNPNNPNYKKWRREAGKLGAASQITQNGRFFVSEERSTWAKLGAAATLKSRIANGTLSTEATRRAAKNASMTVVGAKWMNNGIITKMILRDDVQKSIDSGWTFGRIKHSISSEF